ncbi:hypothetical protein O0L34_g10575 [Tuta absoluta]|nr:hypothetical protein O0L34_g10575 [Tuta absoluta]
MPIIPSVVGFDCADIELRQKLKECVQIEVNQDDKMPPLICELCVDKVNDFYEFLLMCRETNVKTRQRLGLPEPYPQSSVRENSEGDDCILGVTEPVFVQDDDDEPLSRRQAGNPPPSKRKEDKKKDRVKSLKKELKNLIKTESVSRSTRDGRATRRDHRAGSSSSRSSRTRSSPTPVRETRQSATSDMTLGRSKEQQSKNDSTQSKSILKKLKEEIPSDTDEEAAPILKRARDNTDSRDTPQKKIKLTIKLPPRPPTPPKTKPKPGPKCTKVAESPPLPPSGPKTFKPGPKSSKTESPKPGPKFSKTESPKPGPKSSKIESLKPGPKSSKTESPKPVPKSSKIEPKPGPKSSKVESHKPGPKSRRPPSPAAPEHVCHICEGVFQAVQGLTSHIRSQHIVKYTPATCACNACGEWFTSAEETTAHHKQHKNKHKPYKCRGCQHHFRQYNDYNQHIADTSCVPWTEVPDVKCAECWKTFPTDNLRTQHRCAGRDARPGGKCSKCSRSYQTLKSLKKHESACTTKKKSGDPLSEARVPPWVRTRLLHAQVLIARCDKLLAPHTRGRYHVARLAPDFGCSRRHIYPYRTLVRVKQEPLAFDGMVHINKDIRDEFYKEEDYVHWDSDNFSSDEEFSLITPTEKRKKVPSLTTLALKTIYSRRCLGKVPRKLRKVKEKFDSFYNAETEFDNVQDDINNIISNLGDDTEDNESSFSVNNIKLTDVKSMSEMVKGSDNDFNGANYESDSLLDDDKKTSAVDEKVDFNAKNSDNEQNFTNNLFDSVKKSNADNGSETDASIDDTNSEKQIVKHHDDKSTASELSQDLDSNLTNSELLLNGKGLQTEVTEKSNGGTENQSDLINDINELYDKNLMDELDAQIGGKESDLAEKSDDKITLEDLVPEPVTNKNVTSLDAISDEEFNFDA